MEIIQRDKPETKLKRLEQKDLGGLEGQDRRACGLVIRSDSDTRDNLHLHLSASLAPNSEFGFWGWPPRGKSDMLDLMTSDFVARLDEEKVRSVKP